MYVNTSSSFSTQSECFVSEFNATLDYPSTSRKRIIDFHLSNQDFLGTKQTLYIDGIGPSTYPLKINVLKCDIETFHDEDRTRIFRTVYPDETSLKFSGFPTSIGLLQPGEVSTSVVEKWALEYVYQYAKTKNSRATGFLFGIEYAARGLPHVSHPLLFK